MDKELHEKALDAAITEAADAVKAPGVSMFRRSADRDKWVMEQAIAAYLRTAGLTVVPVEPTAEMVTSARLDHEGDAYLPYSLYASMLAAFPSPFDEVK